MRSTDYELDVHQHIPPYPCESVTEVERPKGAVPHLLPGMNTLLNEFADRYGVPREATRGGAETMYPEYRKKLKGAKAKLVTKWQCGNKFLIAVFGIFLGTRSQHNRASRVKCMFFPSAETLYMLAGAGGNITVSIGPDGVLMVDTGLAAMSDKVLAAVRQIQTATATNGVTVLRSGAEGRSSLRAIVDTAATAQADSLHHQYASPPRSYRRQRKDRQGRQDLHRRERGGESIGRSRGSGHPGA